MTRALVALGRTRDGVLLVGYQQGNAVGGLSEEITAAAEELADQAFTLFADKVKNEIPVILEANQVALRETAAAAIAEGLRRSDIDQRLASAKRSFTIGIAVSTIIGIIGTAVLTTIIHRGST